MIQIEPINKKKIAHINPSGKIEIVNLVDIEKIDSKSSRLIKNVILATPSQCYNKLRSNLSLHDLLELIVARNELEKKQDCLTVKIKTGNKTIESYVPEKYLQEYVDEYEKYTKEVYKILTKNKINYKIKGLEIIECVALKKEIALAFKVKSLDLVHYLISKTQNAWYELNDSETFDLSNSLDKTLKQLEVFNVVKDIEVTTIIEILKWWEKLLNAYSNLDKFKQESADEVITILTNILEEITDTKKQNINLQKEVKTLKNYLEPFQKILNIYI